MEYVLETQGLRKIYKNCKALCDLDLHVPRGTIYGLVGRNGAGKTTLIRLVTSLQRPTAGNYWLYGARNDEKAVGKARRRMGAVVETPSVYMDMSARENLQTQYKVLGLPSTEGIDELLELVGLENTGRKKVRDFSLGMRQRLGIAVALCGEPDLLLLDEPVNGLDPQGIVEIRELVLRLNRERQITVLISSHILDELSRLATWYGFMDGGRMLREISAEELEKSCRKCMRVQLSDARALTRVLNREGVDYSVLSPTQADIFGKMSVSALSQKLAAEGCELLSVQERDESLESYYLSLLGGESHA